MNRFVLAPEAAQDLTRIWRYINRQSSPAIADRVENVIRKKIVALASAPGIGHKRPDLTSEDVRFFAVYSYLIVYRADTRPLQVFAILHGAQDVARVLLERFQ